MGDVASDNMQLWNSVEHTDPKHAKQTNNGRFDFTCIDPTSQLKRATEKFGPYGTTWGLFNLRFTPLNVDGTSVLMLEATFMYTIDGHTIEFPIAVDMKHRPNDDTCKKLVTSARSKALSHLGFNADVFMGKFDDAAYVKDREKEFGDKDRLAEEIIGKIRTAPDLERLATYEARVEQMAADGTIDMTLGSRLSHEIAAKRESLEAESTSLGE